MSKQDYEQSQWYQEDFLANHSVRPGSDEARRMTVTSGQKCCELYRRSDPLGSLVRMLLGSSVWRSTRCYLTWKISGTPAKRLLFRLVPSTPRTDETAVPLWATPNTMDYLPQRSPEALQRQAETSRKGRARPANLREQVCEETMRLWPTPTAGQCGMTATTGGRPIEKSTKLSTQVYLAEQAKLIPTPTARCGQSPCKHGQGGPDLATYIESFPTPIASDWKNRGCKDARQNRQCQLQTTVGGQLNPTWVEWLMGFPIGWTNLDASETPSCPRSSTRCSKP